MLRWGLLKSTKQVPEHFSITCVDPAVPALLKEFPTEMFEERAENLKQAMTSFRKVFFPIFSAQPLDLAGG